MWDLSHPASPPRLAASQGGSAIVLRARARRPARADAVTCSLAGVCTRSAHRCAGAGERGPRQKRFHIAPADKRSPAASHRGGGGGGSCQKPGKTPAPGRPAAGREGAAGEKAQPAEPSRPGPTVGAGGHERGCAWGAGPRLKRSGETSGVGRRPGARAAGGRCDVCAAAAAAASQGGSVGSEPSAALPVAPNPAEPGQPPPASIVTCRLPLARPSKGPADTAGGRGESHAAGQAGCSWAAWEGQLTAGIIG